MSIQWLQEACDLRPDPVTGAKITRLTSAPVISNNIYCEVPYGSPDGSRIIIVRYSGLPPNSDSGLYVVDLERLRLCRVEGFRYGENAAWGEWVFSVNDAGDIQAFSMLTFDKKIVFSASRWRGQGRPSVTRVAPDERAIVYTALLPGPTIGVGVIDLEEQANRIIFEHPEIVNPHAQFDPAEGKWILIQHNRGSKLAPDGTVERIVGEEGTTLFVLDHAGHAKWLPAGPPHTSACTGHECFIGNTGRVVFTTHWSDFTGPGPLDSRFPDGNLFTAAPGDASPRGYAAAEHRFNHVSVSRCGRFWLCDSYGKGIPGPIPLVVGSFKTGHHRALLQDCKASCGGAQFTHPHAYFTADSRRIIYNADPDGIPHVFMAEIPKGFLQGLE